MQRALHRLHLRAGRRGRISLAAGAHGRRNDGARARRASPSTTWSASKTASFPSDRDAKASRCCARRPLRARSKSCAANGRTERSTSTPTAACRRRWRAASMPGSTRYALALTRSGRTSTPRITGRIGYGLEDVLASVRLACQRGLRVSLNLLTHPGVTDDAGRDRGDGGGSARILRSRWYRPARSTSIRNGISPPSAGRARRLACAPRSRRCGGSRASETSRTRTDAGPAMKLWQIVAVVAAGVRVRPDRARALGVRVRARNALRFSSGAAARSGVESQLSRDSSGSGARSRCWPAPACCSPR